MDPAIPQVQERLNETSGLSNVANRPPGQPVINEYTFVPQTLTSVGYQGHSLPSAAPLPPSENETCSLTAGQEPRGYTAGDRDVIEPYRISKGKESIFRQPLSEQQFSLNRQEQRKMRERTRRKIEELPETSFDGMAFAIFSDQELKKISVADVDSAESEGKNTVNDPRFGVVYGNQSCSTCTNTIGDCPGHYGRIELKSPYSPELYQRLIVRVLNSICLECRRVLLTENDLFNLKFWSWSHPPGDPRRRKIWRYHHEERLKQIENYIHKSQIKCTRPGRCPPNPEFKYNRDKRRIEYKIKGSGNKWELVHLEQIRFILEQIPNEDAILLGFEPPSHPERLILKSLPVPPLCVRPPRRIDGRDIPDDLTATLQSIIRRNKKIVPLTVVQEANQNRGPFPKVVLQQEADHNRAGYVSKLVSEIDKLIFSSGKDERFTSIRKLIQGKKGLIRRFMMGKRGDFSARTVLSPGPELELGQIGIPRAWAVLLTYPVLVTAENKEALIDLMRAGKVEKVRLKRRGGLQRTVDPDNIPTINPGDIIERHLQDGDFVAFNRNPSLHKFSIMGYEVVLVDGWTIHLPIHTTPHHNADFDGDEGNVYLPRSIDAEAELRTVMNSRYCIISGQDNRPLTGVVFNDLTAAYELTLPGVVVREQTWTDCMKILNRDAEASQLANRMGRFEENLTVRLQKYGLKPRSGRALFSALLPEDFYYQKGRVRIIEGILVRGQIDKSTGGASHRSIAQFIVKNYNRGRGRYGGAERAAKFLSDAQDVLKRWYEDQPLTTSLADCNPKKDPSREVIPFYELTKNVEKLALLNMDLCQEIMERNSRYVRFDEEFLTRLYQNSGITFEDKPISGHALISALLPRPIQTDRGIENFNVVIEADAGSPKIVTDGILNPEIEFETKDGAKDIQDFILKEISRQRGTDRAFAFSRDLRTLMERCLGISLQTGKHYEMIAREQERTRAILETYGPKLNDPVEGQRAREIIATELNRVQAVGEKMLTENLEPNNNFTKIVSGAKTKGGPANIGQIGALIGPQFRGAQLIGEGGTTIYQAPGDMDPKGFGFVESNFLKGLGVEEFFFHAMAGREGMVDTSIKTAVPGTLTRYIVKNMESVLTQRDGTVRLQGQQIIQSLYGYTGFNPEKLINVSFPEGDIPFFIDLESVVERVNAEEGWDPEDAPVSNNGNS